MLVAGTCVPTDVLVAGKNQLLRLSLKISASMITRTQTATVALPQINQAGR
jgi:hypothetical protein